MAALVICPQCDFKKVTDKFSVGNKVVCSKCKTKFTVTEEASVSPKDLKEPSKKKQLFAGFNMQKIKSLVKWVRLRPKIEKYCYLGIIITTSYALLDAIAYKGIIYNNYTYKFVPYPSHHNFAGQSSREATYIGKTFDEFSLSVWLIISLFAAILILGGKNK